MHNPKLPNMRTVLLPTVLANNYANYTEFAQAVSSIKLEKLQNLCETADTIDSLKLAMDSNQKDVMKHMTWFRRQMLHHLIP